MFVLHANTHHVKIKLCKDCINFDPSTERCKAFKNFSAINGTFSLPKAFVVRSRVDFCGIGAKYYKDIDQSKFKKDAADILNKEWK
jgi:hypothetical protein